MGKRRGAYRALMRRPKGKILHGRPRCRGKDNTKMDLQEVRWGGAWTGLIWFRTGKGADCCECGNGPSSSIICRRISELTEELFFLGRTLLLAVMESPFS